MSNIRPPASLQKGRDSDLKKAATTIPAKEARAKFAQLINAARIDRSRLVITDYGEPAAAVVPLKDLRALELFDQLGLTDRSKDWSYEEVPADELIDDIISELTAKRGAGAAMKTNAVREKDDEQTLRVRTTLKYEDYGT
jgi:prevent-host-death family protein